MDILAPNIENVLSSHGKLQTNYVSAIAWLYCACVEGLTTIYAQGPPPPHPTAQSSLKQLGFLSYSWSSKFSIVLCFSIK